MAAVQVPAASEGRCGEWEENDGGRDTGAPFGLGGRGAG